MTDDLIAFFEARLDDDERVARAKRPTWDDDEPADAEDLWNAQVHTSDCGYRMGAFNDDCICEAPSFTLAEVDAKRRILDEFEQWHGRDLPAGMTEGRDPDEIERDEMVRDILTGVVQNLAQPYASHPSFRDEWKIA